MTIEGERRQSHPPEWLARLKRARLALAAVAAIFGLLFWSGGLGVGLALGAAAIIAVAILLSASGGNAQPVAITDDKRAALQVHKQLIEAVLAGLPDPVVAVDRQGNVAAFNAPALALAPGLRRGEPVSRALRTPEVLDALRRAGASGAAQRAEYLERAPVERWYEVMATPIGEGEAVLADGLVLLAFRDLTPLRRVEEMRADFVANASHELRTPLAALSGFIETLQGSARNDPAAQERFLGIMQAQATRMARLIDDLLSLSRIELNAHRRPETVVDLVPIVRQVADGLQTLARDRDMAVNVQAPQQSLTVRGDRDELLRVFENLIENALKYAASGKKVDIAFSLGSAPKEGGEVQVVVRDYGSGISPEHLPRLTERFYRVDVADSRAQGGTGLGLALVKHILNRHGGHLTIESLAGQGATFTAHLPLADPTAA
jgi:two-component system phosphate regulon sensor histidine kinase PhoR